MATSHQVARQYVLDLPWGMPRHSLPPGVTWVSAKKLHVYHDTTGAGVPASLVPFQTKPYTYLRWVEDDLNQQVGPVPQLEPITPHPHQVETATSMVRAFTTGWPGFLIASGTGTGKTIGSLLGVAGVLQTMGFAPNRQGRLLVVCPKSVIPQWQQTFRSMPMVTALCRPMIVNYEQLGRLLTVPADATVKAGAKKKTVARVSVPTINWDVVVFDESHKLKNYPNVLTGIQAERVAQLHRPYTPGKRPFTVFLSATPGSSPLHLTLMSGFLGRLINPAHGPVLPSRWGDFLHREGFAVEQRKVKGNRKVWKWAQATMFGRDATSTDPKVRAKHEERVNQVLARQTKDMVRIGKALSTAGAPYINHQPTSIAGWPKQQIIPFYLDLPESGLQVYHEAWTRFRQILALGAAGRDPDVFLTELMRFRQKSSLLKIEPMVGMIADQVDDGAQVVVSCQFVDTIETYQQRLTEAGIPTVVMTGQTPNREAVRVKFQKGQANVILTSLTEGISLHANERLADGTVASAAPRVTVLHELRLSDVDSAQALGRAHRDKQASVAYIPAFLRTIDEQVVRSFVAKSSNLNALLSGQETHDLQRVFQDSYDRFIQTQHAQ